MTNPVQKIRDELNELSLAARQSPQDWGDGVTLSFACRRPQPYEAVLLAESRGLVRVRGVGRHHLIWEFENVVPDESWVVEQALPALAFFEEVGGTNPRISVDRASG